MIEVPASSGYFKPLPDAGGGFASKKITAVSEKKRPLRNRFSSRSETTIGL